VRKGIRQRAGESRVLRVVCTDADGTVRKHTARVAPDGQIGFFDHPRGELARGLKVFALAGVAPTGCYAALLIWQQILRGAMGGGPSRTVACADLTSARYSEFLCAAMDTRKLRGTLRKQTVKADIVQDRPVRGGRVWALTLLHPERVAGLTAYGVPSMLSVSINGGAVAWGGFVAVRPRRSTETLLWDVSIPGVEGLVANGCDHPWTPGVVALMRMTRRVLRGWRGIVCGPENRQQL
jgi:hypothetical protein